MATGRQFDIPAAPILIVAPSEYTRRDCDVEPIGVALNGVPIFSSALGRTCTQLDEHADAAWAGIDFCGGSVLAGGEYGYRVPPSCLHAQAKEVGMPSAELMREATAPDDGHSPQIGWSLDGFPVYGPFEP